MSKLEPIAEVLEKINVLLTFSTYTIYGLPGFELTILYKGEQSLYEVLKQEFEFRVASTDVVANTIITGDTFSIEDTAYKHTFKVGRTPTPDLTGWTVLHVDYISKAVLSV